MRRATLLISIATAQSVWNWCRVNRVAMATGTLARSLRRTSSSSSGGKFGFRVAFACIDDSTNDLVWAVEHDGDFAAAEAEYLHSPERAATPVGAPQVMRSAKIGLATRLG